VITTTKGERSKSADAALNDTSKAQLIDVHRLAPEQATSKLIDHAASLGASDLFLVTNEQHLAVLVRHLGIVRTISILPLEQAKRILSHIKANSGMDLSEKRQPADGRWIYEKDDQTIDLRINIIPTLYGEDFAIRLFTRDASIYALEKLGMGREQLQQYQSMITSPSGLILITGPTGSGKTATLYASLMRLNDGKRKINTIEDPVEYAIDGLRQSQVNPAISLGFRDLLRSVLRQSPDVIMIGEIRDEETARTAVHAANSGILVFATLHAPSASSAVQSMRALGVHTHFLASGLRGVVAQRLVRTLCPKCKVSFDLADAPHTFDDVRPWLAADEGKALFAPRGCDACNMTGYSARTGVFEVMPITKELRDLISDGKSPREIRAKAVEQRMAEFRPAALLKVARGETSTEEVFRVIPAEHMLMDD
jgi:type II secretory ATPase GspE/PulE/Tfp pilus assembly ATPase PilB-like protein